MMKPTILGAMALVGMFGASLGAANFNLKASNLYNEQDVQERRKLAMPSLDHCNLSPEAQGLFGVLHNVVVGSGLPDDPRFDVATTYLAALNYVSFVQWPSLTSAAVWSPLAQTDHPSIQCGLAPIQVPLFDEHWPQTSPAAIQLVGCLLQATPFPETADQCGHWHPQESNQVKEMIMAARVLGVRSATKALQPYGANRYSDEVLENIVIHGFAQHLLVKVKGKSSIRKAKYAVYLDSMEKAPVRDGFARMGGNVYFDKKGKVVGIERLGGVVLPGDGEQWELAKLAIRGSLFTYITLVDHLVECHLLVANGIVTANVEEFSPTHPIRMLMTIFGYRTEAINAAAALSLTPEHGTLHRSMPYSKEGFEVLYAAGIADRKKFKSIPDRFKDQRVNKLKLSLHEDGSDFYDIVENFVEEYVDRHYDKKKDCRDDVELNNWWDRVSGEFIELPKLKKCKDLEEVLSTFIYLVTAGHNHAGNVRHLTDDPALMPFSVREGELSGPPRTSLTMNLISSMTSFDVPKITDDYKHVLPAESQDLWDSFTSDLKELGETVEKRNEERPHPFRSFDPSIIETSVGI